MCVRERERERKTRGVRREVIIMLLVDAKMFACKQTDYIESGFPETFAYFFFPILFPALFCHKTRKNFNQEPISISSLNDVQFCRGGTGPLG